MINKIYKAFIFFKVVGVCCSETEKYNFVKPLFSKLSGGFIKVEGGLMCKNGFGKKGSSIVKVSPFIVSDHYVTNAEYRSIIRYANDMKLDKSVDILIPNYDVFSGEYQQYGINSNLLVNYFTDPKYDNYPVVGITYAQILEFIRLKSMKDNVNYRLLTDDEYDFLVNEIKNVHEGGDIKIIQNETFDETIKKAISFNNDIIKQNVINSKKKTVKGFFKRLFSRKKKKDDEVIATLAVYNPTNYYNLRVRGFNINMSTPFYSDVYKFKPNEFNIYDLVGNVYEITSRRLDIYDFVDDDKEGYEFILCGCSCFDYYDDIYEELPKFIDTYDTVRCDRGFRLAITA